jgi:hypothetical protein
MTAFDTAWDIVKMARHVVNDLVEIWDDDEESFGGVYNRPAPEGYGHLPTVFERSPMPEDYGFSNTDGNLVEVDTFDGVPESERRYGSSGTLYRAKSRPKSEWWSFRAGSVDPSLRGLRGDGYVYGGGLFSKPKLPEGRDKPLTFEEIVDIHRQYYDDDKNWTIHYPWAGGIGRGDYVKINLTPNEFLNLASEGHDEERAMEFVEQWKKNEGRTPIGMPYLRASMRDRLLQEYRPTGDKKPLSGPQDFKITGHEGRHRMAALRAMGYGDTPLPVKFELDSYDRHAFGMNPKGRNEGLEQALGSGISFLYPQNVNEDKLPVSLFNRNNTTWGQGEVEYLDRF